MESEEKKHGGHQHGTAVHHENAEHSSHNGHDGHNGHSECMHKNEGNIINRPVIVLTGLLVMVILFNQFQIYGISRNLGGSSGIASTSDVLPKGVPDIYGQELGIRFDDVSAANPSLADSTIKKLGAFDNQISLSGDELNRYISIVSKISCEYCCGAESIIFKNGQAACGCAHSYAMRGLAKYLIKNHGPEYTDDEILGELGKWKVLFFPGKMVQKAAVLKEKGIELNYINLASNKYRGIESGAAVTPQGTSGGMVGGC